MGRSDARTLHRVPEAGAALPAGLVLARDRGELIMADRETLLHEASRLKMRLVALPYHPSNARVHLLFNRKTVSEEDLQRIHAAQERLAARGMLRAIRMRYDVRH